MRTSKPETLSNFWRGVLFIAPLGLVTWAFSIWIIVKLIGSIAL